VGRTKAKCREWLERKLEPLRDFNRRLHEEEEKLQQKLADSQHWQQLQQRKDNFQAKLARVRAWGQEKKSAWRPKSEDSDA